MISGKINEMFDLAKENGIVGIHDPRDRGGASADRCMGEAVVLAS